MSCKQTRIYLTRSVCTKSVYFRETKVQLIITSALH